MKTRKITNLLFAALATLLLIPSLAIAQSTQSKSKPVSISGRVSPDAQILIDDKDTKWTISNPQTLKGHEGQPVTVKCHLAPDQKTIHVVSVKAASEIKYTVNLGDSAFRR